MGIAGSIVVYLLLWWLCFLSSLSFGLGPPPASSRDMVPGQDRGAPDNPLLWRKAIIATLVSAVLFSVVQVLVLTGWISIPGVH